MSLGSVSFDCTGLTHDSMIYNFYYWTRHGPIEPCRILSPIFFQTLRQVLQERICKTITSELGYIRLYTRASYQETHGGKSPEDDGCTSQTLQLPDGSSKEVFKADSCKAWGWLLWAGNFHFSLMFVRVVESKSEIHSQCKTMTVQYSHSRSYS